MVSSTNRVGGSPRPLPSAAPAAPANLAAGKGPTAPTLEQDQFAEETRTARALIDDLRQAPPSFPIGKGKSAVYVDIQRCEATLDIDVAAQQANVQARVEFQQPSEGCPVIDLVADPASIQMDGKSIGADAFPVVTTRDSAAQTRVISQNLPAGAHTLELTYALKDAVRFGGRSEDFEFKMAMRDLVPRRYLEQCLPSNLLYDRFPVKLHLNLKGAPDGHRVLTNAEVQEHGDGSYTLDFAKTYNSCAPFLQIVPPGRAYVEETYPGLAGPIPLRICAKDPELAAEALAKTKEVMAELEATFGPFPHPTFTAYIGRPDDPGVGGMEYAGATETTMDALGHEMLHSYFGRGVMPGTGNAGWLDEAIARWRDNGYPQAERVELEGTFPKLSGFSPYARQNTRDAYDAGAKVMSELDFLLRDQGGLRPILKDFVQTYRGETITTEMFRKFVEERSNLDVSELFQRKVYGSEQWS